MKILSLIAVAVIVLSASLAFAAERTVKLDVANATCELCGPIVKRALTRVSGVLDVKVAETEGATVATVVLTSPRSSRRPPMPGIPHALRSDARGQVSGRRLFGVGVVGAIVAARHCCETQHA
jgi:mercuric ion binding protein